MSARRQAPGALFELGAIVATPGALAALREAHTAPRELLARHQGGDWGAVPPEDARENDLSVREGFRILSSYPLSTGAVCWVLTERDRSATTLLLPEDY